MKKVLITGITGFAGSHLAEYLINNKDYKISGNYLVDQSLRNISNIKDKVDFFKINLINFDETRSLIKSVEPDFIYHLAALTSPGDSFKNPAETFANNATAQINLLEAVREIGLNDSRILIISSADIYGKVSPADLPISEKTNFMPTNPYAVSKIAQDFLGLQYFLSYNLKITRVRPFNHIGPRQSPNFVVSSFAKRIAEIEKSEGETVLKVGNLETKRDFTDVRDIVRGYSLALEKGEPGEVYNLGSGVSYKIEDILHKLLSFSNKKIKVEADDSLIRPSDAPELLCDNKKFKELTGWEPAFHIDETLKETLDYWRKII